METSILLLRGVNVGGHRKVPMAELRALCSEIGFANVRTYLASGNVVVDVRGGDAPSAAKALEAAMEAHFGFPVDVIARSADAWAAYLADNPFPEQSAAQPNRVMLLLANRTPAADAVETLRERAGIGELVQGVRDGIWIYYAAGAADTKITPVGIDKAVGAPTTSRNWRTVQALHEMASAGAKS